MADQNDEPRSLRRLFGRRRAEPESGQPAESGEEAPLENGGEPVVGAEVEVEVGAESAPVAAAPGPPGEEPTAAPEEAPGHDTISEPVDAVANAVGTAPPAAEPVATTDTGVDAAPEPAVVAASGTTATMPRPIRPEALPEGETLPGAGAPVAPEGGVEEEAGREDDVPRPLELPRILAIANQKGGVGKTTTAVNLGAALAESGLRVLVVDLDPQGNATTGLGINPRDVEASIYDVMMHDTPALDAVEPTSLKNLFVIPATIDLAGAEIELVPAFSRELKLKRALEPLRAEYDVVMIDCPPSLGLLTVNGLAAADDVIVPIQCEYYALEGLGQLLRNVALVRSSLNPDLDVRGSVLAMFDARTRLAEQVESEVREHFGEKVYRTVVPRTVRLSEAPSFGQPIIVFDSSSRGASAYRALAKEVRGGATRRTG